jgi:hypothetical protein
MIQRRTDRQLANARRLRRDMTIAEMMSSWMDHPMKTRNSDFTTDNAMPGFASAVGVSCAFRTIW